MSKRVMKHNPAFLSPAELVDQFVVRQEDLASVVQTVRENSTSANQHVLIVGPRGSGKTMLVRRLAAEIDLDPELRTRWYPLIFSEESYEVTTPGEFWLEAAFHLGRQTKDPRWQAKYDEYGSQWRDEETLRERALGQLVAFADEQGKRILLIVENLNALLGDQLSDDDAWKLRHTLQNEPRLMLLATATSRFEEIDQANKAMYELFRVHHLRPLGQDDCRALWHALTGELLAGDAVRPIQILTGGNVRLLTILSSFGAGLSLRRLMTDLVGLVDEHTAYFKSHLDALPAVERKVYLALAELWDPCTAKAVAAAARMDVNRTSALLGRLLDRGAVVALDQPGRTRWYQLAERMYNIYYLFRRRGSPAERVRAVVRFMVSFYPPERLVTVADHIADEVAGLTPEERRDHYEAFCGLMNQPQAVAIRDRLAEVARKAFACLPDVPDSLACMIRSEPPPDQGQAAAGRDAAELLNESCAYASEGRLEDAERTCRQALDLNAQYAPAWGHLGWLNENLGRFAEAEQAYRTAAEADPKHAFAWTLLGMLYERLSRFDEAEQAYRTATEADPKYAIAWTRLGMLYERLSRFDEAEQAYRTATEADPTNVCLQGVFASFQCLRGKIDEYSAAVESWLANKEALGEMLSEATDLFVDLAARGEGRRAVQVLTESPSAELLEPLIVGIRIFLGEDVMVAAEIKEVGQDVARRITQRRDARGTK